MAATREKAMAELSRAVSQLVVKEPFFGHLLSNVIRVVSEKRTPTAGVALSERKVILAVNPGFFAGAVRRKAERVGIVKHEVLHLLFKHLLRREPWHDALLFNVAADLVVNQLIGRPWELPASAITLSTFADLELEPDQTVEHYYRRLLELARDAGSAPQSAAALAGIRQEPEWHSDHRGWTAAEMDPVARQVAGAEIGRWVEQAARRAGDAAIERLPETLREAIQLWIDERHPQLQWRRVLRMFNASARRSRVLPTLRRPSKRYGTFPGNRVRRMSHLAVAVDTSGSIGPDDLGDFFSEIRGLWRAGAEITVIECDLEVQRVWAYRGRHPERIFGRGGTSFDPVFRWLRDQRRRFDGCVYLTDGLAARPTIAPPCKLLWVVTSDGESGPHLRPGRVVTLGRR